MTDAPAAAPAAHADPATPRFTDRVALVTGASRGIGLAVAARLVAEGARVVLTARGAEDLEEAARSLGGEQVALAVAGRADDPEHRTAALTAAVETFGGIDVLVNNTGINPQAGPLTDMEDRAMAKLFAVNVSAAVAWTGQAIRMGLGSRPGASVVNMASIAGVRPAPPIGGYGASKAALIHVTSQLALELAPRIRVNAVAPAVIRTAFSTMLYDGREEQVAAGYPLGRLGAVEDVAAAVAFLAGPDASWVTGQTLVLDGGLTLRGGEMG